MPPGWIGALIVLVIGLYVYLLSPRYWEHSDRYGEDAPGLLRAIWTVVGVQFALLVAFVLAVGIYYVATGNTAGRLIGVGLLAGLGIAFARGGLKYWRKGPGQDPEPDDADSIT
jgi:hypothetical protein